jgi:hypothetical protein
MQECASWMQGRGEQTDSRRGREGEREGGREGGPCYDDADVREVMLDGLEYPEVSHTLQLNAAPVLRLLLLLRRCRRCASWLPRRWERPALLLGPLLAPPLGTREPRRLRRIAAGSVRQR